MANGAVQVTYFCGTRRCSAFLSKKAFFADFTNFRQESAKQVTVRRWPVGSYLNHYDCKSADSSRTHTVRVFGGLILCSCEDYQRQQESVGKLAACKHVYAVLNHLQYANLENFLEAKEKEARESLFI